MKISLKQLRALIREAVEEAIVSEKLDPVGHEDEDVNNDGKIDATDDYLLSRRKKISAAVQK